ncbi:PQQ-binding-like beta-propeller repeat protein [Streptomyces sp. ZAF1911]|uniref:outer membrane protein assembly factor BamB family protein n=1 Tax=Streptomyces sp. ZAF1911 TaxID=2944129 RepID=UPI00237A0DE0|nr:PQQ-binding-like beta-propeller repeat protein [Streptomyces sp. ZAF1911]MDD9381703.1 PQQ-binding-like beta-propeller repeat protein [Streptomyces sp. ZAF1911]
MIATVLWERELHQRGGGSVFVVGPDCVVLHERHTRLVCLERADGAVRWDVPLGSWPRGIALAGDRVLVLPQNPNLLSCIDLRTGASLWSAPTPRWTGNLTVHLDTVVIGGWRGYTPMSGLDLADGGVRWATPSAVTSVRTVAWAGGVLTGSGHEAVLLDPADGSDLARWRLPDPLTGPDAKAFVPVDAERVVAVCEASSLVTFGVDAAEPARLGSYDRVGAVGYIHGSVWMLPPGRGFLAVDPADGTSTWSVEADRRIVVDPLPYDDGVLLGDANGGIRWLGPDSRTVEECSLPGRRLDALAAADDGGLFFAAKGTFGSFTLSPKAEHPATSGSGAGARSVRDPTETTAGGR